MQHKNKFVYLSKLRKNVGLFLSYLNSLIISNRSNKKEANMIKEIAYRNAMIRKYKEDLKKVFILFI
ncbi:hypothetical protein BWK62_07685 [Flavobacterium oreochromis]|uniref:Uncharacterized protein n=1 Tax=Flavobacterium columnare TaxID=996 RepID=A0A246GCR1_9FLAO|nr:hypothetical protein BWK62_07685 [Flavobacterium oreochromis]